MMKRYAVLGMIIALVVSIAAIGCSSGSSKPESTPTNPPTHTAAPTATATEETNEAATATSLAFTIQVDTQGVVYTYTYSARNIGTSSLDVRVEVTSEQFNGIYIVSGSTREGWIYSGEEWIEFTTMYQDFDTFWTEWAESFEGYQNYLAEEWTGVEGWTYTVPGMGTVTYTDIEINPTLPDSLFQPD